MKWLVHDVGSYYKKKIVEGLAEGCEAMNIGWAGDQYVVGCEVFHSQGCCSATAQSVARQYYYANF